MGDDAKPSGPSADDLAAMARYAGELADGLAEAVPAWVRRCVETVYVERMLRRPPDEVATAAERAAAAAADDVVPRIRTLLAADIDDQTTNPLSLVRPAVRHPTEVLRAAGVPPAPRDDMARRQFPDDVYDLTPASFAELDPALHEPGLRWGAAKAHVHLARRRAEGRR
ncbi:hypothetical protein [Rhabdothermincola salaria]|uniref:hypothetical protein n=1 Tax=Rhabdothermincola salaria TaxID=2903142 RepID=UPI001E64B976|nr:hypothetical protein [Rhabdothermincola salaria]MCD9624739.1 hypothetical protein [Rhabdothermincola salaria]